MTYDPKTANWPVQSTAMTVACKVKYSLASKELEYISLSFVHKRSRHRQRHISGLEQTEVTTFLHC